MAPARNKRKSSADLCSRSSKSSRNSISASISDEFKRKSSTDLTKSSRKSSFSFNPEEFKHCGFLLAVLNAQCSSSVEIAPKVSLLRSNGVKIAGRECFLSGQGPKVSLLCGNGVEIAEEMHLCPIESSEDSENRSNKRGLIKSITLQLQKLVSKNSGVKVRGTVLKVFQKEADARAIVLLDVYIQSMQCVVLSSSWKAGPVSAFVMSHLSSDWSLRKQLLAMEEINGDIWNPPECHVLGCTIHTNSMNKEKFDLDQIFRLLSASSWENRSNSSSCIYPAEDSSSKNMPDLPDDVLTMVFNKLLPRDLASIASTCRHTRELTRSVIPCMNLKLFPHQKAAVQWMLHRETNPRPYANPMFKLLQTEDKFHFYLNTVTGEMSLERPEDVEEFRGGLFCDEPGLGKTITALSLILKSQGSFPSPPEGVDVCWCDSPSGENIGYYEVAASTGFQGMSLLKRCVATKGRRQSSEALDYTLSCEKSPRVKVSEASDYTPSSSEKPTRAKRKLLDTEFCDDENTEQWVQCDACKKWRTLGKGSSLPKEGTTWFCMMNTNPLYQSCSVPEEDYDSKEKISLLEGFYRRDHEPGSERNVAFFTSILKTHANLLVSDTKRVLKWLAEGKTSLGSGFSVPHQLRMTSLTGSATHGYEDFFKAFGLIPVYDKKKKALRWEYPRALKGFEFDTVALKTALGKPVEEVTRIYLSKATLVVVPVNLVDHWKTQIQRHTKDRQLRVYVCVDSKLSPMPHGLAWDYDVVITTFNRLSSEWSSKENSLLMRIHWFRIILDEGHTLGASASSLTNKLQMAVNMHASRRWVLTGTPTPGTVNSQLVHLHPMLRFLHEGLYGSQIKLWDSAIMRPFEACEEEGRVRLLDLLGRCMISARKSDLSTIPPCIRRSKLIVFNDKHAASYNELVETVRRNLTLADWNDPDHVESLLNSRNWKMRNATLRNVRLACCVAGQMKVANSDKDIQETMDMLVEHGLDPASNEYLAIQNGLQYGGNCSRCDEWSRLRLLTPCRHFLCLICVSLDCQKCTKCEHPYKMQKPKARPENPNPKWEVPQDLIELQPSYIQDDWHPEWQLTASSKVAYLVEQLQALLCEEKKDNLPHKSIVFSQFLEHINAIELQLTKAGIKHVGMYSPMHSINKMKSLKTFQEDTECLVLLMDGSSALGLDLSFVNRVYLMEPIWDRSVEEQVISRAHRMGATRPVLVETLAMSGTIEEQILQRDTRNNQNNDPEYLTRLTFARPTVPV